MSDDALVTAQETFSHYTDGFESIVLGTVNKDAVPNASYAPFVKDTEGNFYVFISGLSEHTVNMEQTQCASVLLLEDEKTCKNIFARSRLTYKCDVQVLERDSSAWENIVELFGERFGKMVGFFKKSPDFRLMQLKPQSGLFVIGFGQAYRVTGEKLDTLSHINDAGHGSAKPAHGHAHAHGAHASPHVH